MFLHGLLITGAGQDVGRSCVLVSVGGKNIMFDCGMHMGYNDERRFPDFSYISKSGNFTQLIDCVIISHFHLDHCGALPYFTEICGYDGPVYMTYPTKAICPILLEDMRKIAVEKKGETNFFTAQMIKASMKKVIAVNVHQTIRVDEDLEIKAYYAGHVLGAAMFYVKAGDQSVVYTGDYNMTPDRHLGAAWMDRVKPDLFITETTYATTIRDSKRVRERDFLRNVHECVERGGKVLIPVFALGRAQELCILLDTYWERMNLGHIPIYFSAGMTEKANYYYKLFIHWTNQKIKKTFVKRNMFEFKHIKPFDRVYADSLGPMVLFATPGMLHAGTSLEVFKKWAPFEVNMCILPGYCVAGTVGNKILTNTTGPQKIEIDKKTTLEVKCAVKSLSFSAHADAKGIMQLIRQVEPKNVLLVHGERAKMAFLKQKIVRELNINCYDPPNGLMKREYERFAESQQQEAESVDSLKRLRSPFDHTPLKGILVMKDCEAGPVRLLDAAEAADEFGLTDHRLTFTSFRALPAAASDDALTKICAALQRWMPSAAISQNSGAIQVSNVSITVDTIQKRLVLNWSYEEEDLAAHVLTAIDRALHSPEASGTAMST